MSLNYVVYSGGHRIKFLFLFLLLKNGFYIYSVKLQHQVKIFLFAPHNFFINFLDEIIPEGAVNPDPHARVRRGSCPYDGITDTFCRAYCAANHRGTGHCVGDGKCQCG